MERADIDHIAELCRLELTEEEAQQLRGDLERILEHGQRLSALKLDAATPSPLIRALNLMELRADVAAPGLDPDRVMALAPRHRGGHIEVPPVAGH